MLGTLQSVAVRCNVLQYVASAPRSGFFCPPHLQQVWISREIHILLKSVIFRAVVFNIIAVRCSALQRVALRCSVSQCVAVCCMLDGGSKM